MRHKTILSQRCVNLRLSALFCFAAGVLAFSTPSFSDIIIDLTYVGSPGNPNDNPPGDYQGGGVNYPYYIGTYEVTVAQYTAFLNAVAQSDPYGLYDERMATAPTFGSPIITRSGMDGSYVYTAVSGAENQPVRYVSYYDALRFCNWLANGQGSGSTETGSYTLALGLWVDREPGASWVLPSEDEWYKAAYYDPVNERYWTYPNGSDTAPQNPTDETTPREFNFGDTPFWQGIDVAFTSIGETTGYSAFGVFDMGGNVAEWTESLSNPIQGPRRVIRGGSFVNESSYALSSEARSGGLPTEDGVFLGFRVAYIPEPSTTLLLLLGGALVFMFKRR